MKRQLASCRHLLQIASHPVAPDSVQRDWNDRVRYWCYCWEVTDCPAHRSELTLDDCHLFRPREKHLAVKANCNRHRREASCHLLDTVAWSIFFVGKQTFNLQWRKCLSVNGGYVESWCIPSATQCHVSDMSYNTFGMTVHVLLCFETTRYRNKSLRTEWRVRECCHCVRNLLRIRRPNEEEVTGTSEVLEQRNLQ